MSAAGKVILVTGSTSGLGLEVARRLVESGATVLLHGRDAERGRAVLDELEALKGANGAGGSARFYQADFSSLDQVRALADQVAADNDRLDVLVNNAGIGSGPPGAGRERSQDGYELRFAVNYLAPYLLTRRLLPLLRASAPSRIVNVASIGQAPIDFDDPQLERGYDGLRAYAQSKLALVMLTFDLAEELRDQGVTVNALHPATLMPTRMVLEAGAPVMSTLADGAAATLRLITDPGLAGETGRFYDRFTEAKAADQAYDLAARARLRALSERLTGEPS